MTSRATSETSSSPATPQRHPQPAGRPRPGGQRANGWVVLVVAGVLAVVAAAAALIAIVVGADRSGTAYVDLVAGDCFDLPDLDTDGDGGGYFDMVDVIDCGRPHEVEVVLVGALDPDRMRPFPGDAVAGEEADARCATVALGAPGSGVSSADVAVVAVAPVEPTWESFQGRFLCLALRIGGGSLVGSVAPIDSAAG